LQKGKADMPHATESGFDIAIVDRENRPVALVQVKAHPVGQNWETFLPKQLVNLPQSVAFVLTIDPNSIHLYQWSGKELTGPLVDLETATILRHYEPEFGKRRVFESYLLTLVEAWFRDLAYHWKSEIPPGSEELRKAGLLDKLEGGTTLPLGD
jgi:hypothetical protein